MSSIYDFLNTEASSSATGGVNAAEGQDPSTVNDGIRQLKQILAAFTDDHGAVNTVGGTADAITVTLGLVGGANSITAYATGQHFRFIAGAANTGAATMNVNGIGAKAIRKISAGSDVALSAGDIAAGETYLVIYRASANSAAGGWLLVGGASVAAATTSAAGIVELATQTEAATLTDTSRAITADGMFFLGGYTTTATAAGTTTLTVTSTYHQYFTGSTTQTLVLPVTSTLVLGRSWRVVNNSTGAVTVQSSGANTILILAAGASAIFTCILTSGTDAASWSYRPAGPTLGTSVASTSGTSIDFTGIPAWVKRVTINFVGVSTNGTDGYLIQLGDAGGVEASGYLGSGTSLDNAASVSAVSSTAGFILNQGNAANVHHGSVTLSLVDASANTWVASGAIGRSNAAGGMTVGGSKSLSAVLDRVRITTTGGTNTFDAGTINISYE